MRQTIMNIFHSVPTRDISNILVAVSVLLAASFLVSCNGTANKAEGAIEAGYPDNPVGVVEMFYKSLGSGECDLAMQFLLFERSREIEVFIRSTASAADIQRLDTEIRGMPEIESTNYVSKEEAMGRLRESLKGHEDVLDTLSGNPLPPSFEITVRDPKDTATVASRFFDDPAVDNTPGKHDGVQYRGETRNNFNYTNFCDRVNSDYGYEISDLNIISSSISDTGEANVKLKVTASMDGVVSKSGELYLKLIKLDGNWKILVDESSPVANSPGLLELMQIEIKESRQPIDTQGSGNIGPDSGIEIVAPPVP